jgi:hypothetical protein
VLFLLNIGSHEIVVFVFELPIFLVGFGYLLLVGLIGLHEDIDVGLYFIDLLCFGPENFIFGGKGVKLSLHH